MVAAQAGSEACLQALLEAGASVEAANDDGWTALHGAAASGSAECVRALIAAGASVCARNEVRRSRQQRRCCSVGSPAYS